MKMLDSYEIDRRLKLHFDRATKFIMGQLPHCEHRAAALQMLRTGYIHALQAAPAQPQTELPVAVAAPVQTPLPLISAESESAPSAP